LSTPNLSEIVHKSKGPVIWLSRLAILLGEVKISELLPEAGAKKYR